MDTENKSRKRAAQDDGGSQKKKKKKVRQDEGDLDAEAGLNLAFARMDGQLIADHIAQKTTRFGTELSTIELSDLYISGKSRTSLKLRQERGLIGVKRKSKHNQGHHFVGEAKDYGEPSRVHRGVLRRAKEAGVVFQNEGLAAHHHCDGCWSSCCESDQVCPEVPEESESGIKAGKLYLG